MHKLTISYKTGEYTKEWHNFCSYVSNIPNRKQFFNITIRLELEKYNCKIDNSTSLEFDTEEDAIAFMLRFG